MAKKVSKAAPKKAATKEEKPKKGDYEHPHCPRCISANKGHEAEGKTDQTRKSGTYTTSDGAASQVWHCNGCGFTWREGSDRKGVTKKGKKPSTSSKPVRSAPRKEPEETGEEKPVEETPVTKPMPKAGTIVKGATIFSTKKIAGVSAVLPKGTPAKPAAKPAVKKPAIVRHQ